MTARGCRRAPVSPVLACICTLVVLQWVRVEAMRSLLIRPGTFTEHATPDYNVYHRKQDLLMQVEQLVKAHPDIMAVETRKAGDTSYNISMQVVHVEPGGITHADSTGRTQPKARLLLDFGEHGREFISSELGLSFLQLLADPPALKALVGGGQRGERLHAILQRSVFKILPMENERGRELVESGQLCERKNGRGVDPNRNWAVDWGRKEKDYDPSEEFPGTAPFSEPEVRVVLDVATALQPHVWLNVHSGMEAMFTPWDHRGEVAAGAADALRLLHTIKEGLFTQSCVVGSGGKSVGYLAHGTATDFMFAKLHVPLAYTWEIYGDMEANFHDCFRMFNPIGQEHVQQVITLWLKAIVRLLELMPTHPALVSEGIFSDLPSEPGSAGSTGVGSGTQSSAGGGAAGSAVATAGKTQGSSEGGEGIAAGRTRAREGDDVLVSPGTPGLPGPSSTTNVLLGVAVLALVAFVVYRWQQQSQQRVPSKQPQIRSWGP